MYDYAGQPSKTAAVVREALPRNFIGSDIGQGYPGDEDNGEMSGWQIFSSLGFYPLQMGSPTYAIGSPLYTKATLHLENGKDLVINAHNNSAQNVYVQGVKVNGQPQSKTYFSQDQLAGGGTIDFDMGPTPSAWGTGANDAPPSITQGGKVPDPLTDATGPGKGVAHDERDKRQRGGAVRQHLVHGRHVRRRHSVGPVRADRAHRKGSDVHPHLVQHTR